MCLRMYKLFGIIYSFELMASISGKANITLVFIYFVVAAYSLMIHMFDVYRLIVLFIL